MHPAASLSLESRLGADLNILESQVAASVALLDSGATVPFIARYRKEVTGSLDDAQLRALEERLRYIRELDERRHSILESIESQGKLTKELSSALWEATTKQRLEDLYLPYKPKRRTKGQIAIEAGLEPLADALFSEPNRDPETEAQAFLNPDANIHDSKQALEGAKYILMERFAEQADLLEELKTYLWDQGFLSVRVISGKEQEGIKFKDYFVHDEAIKTIPSHRALAFFRGRNEGFLSLNLCPENPSANVSITGSTIETCKNTAANKNTAVSKNPLAPSIPELMIKQHLGLKEEGRAAEPWLKEVIRWTWRVKLNTHIETELLGRLREQAEEVAIDVFAQNLKDLLLAAPAGARATLGLDPGFRTGVKVAIIDATGKILDHGAIFPHEPQKQWQPALAQLSAWVKRYQIELIAIGNGTASRETDRLAGDLMKMHPELKLIKVTVSEAGASVYSASEAASKELPHLDVSIRGAVSIARRLQDPLAELVKIEPKAIGVGQYQHDVSQVALARTLDRVIEDCVNAVGVDLNTASASLLAKVAGLNPLVAQNIVDYRDQTGPFKRRASLLKVPRLGAKTFEQAAGFLRIRAGDNPLDASAVHPEAYEVVERMAAAQGTQVEALMNNKTAISAIKPEAFVDEQRGLPTIKDILAELEKPGRDPRPQFTTAVFQEGVETLKDLTDDLILEGVITNVTHFGAFVDIGVHQDGLVHISSLSERFIKDPRELVKTGDIVKVKVMEVDVLRKRIALSMRMSDRAQDYQSERHTPGSVTSAQSTQGTPASGHATQAKPRSGFNGNGKNRNTGKGKAQGASYQGDSYQGASSSQKGAGSSKKGTMAALFEAALNKNKGS